MRNVGSPYPRQHFLATALATRHQQLLAAAIGAAAFLAAVAIVPFARTPLAPVPSFIPSYEAGLFFIDLFTALVLFDQFVRLRSAAVLVLAAGYLFDACMIVPHALTFPGAFFATGLLGAKPQTTAWLYVFWHGGFPFFVMGYALLRRREDVPLPRVRLAIAAAVAGVVALAAGLTLLTTVGHDTLPVVMQGSDYSLLVRKGISPAVWALTLLALVMLWQKQPRVIDLWLMVVMWVWLFDIALSAVIGSARFDLGFYAGRIFGLVAASFLLITLLVEMARLYAGALGAAASAEQRFAELLSQRGRRGNALGRETPEVFIIRQNVAHYRARLELADIDDTQRRSIERLLAEEEAKLAARGG